MLPGRLALGLAALLAVHPSAGYGATPGRIAVPAAAVKVTVTANPSSGTAPLTVRFSAAAVLSGRSASARYDWTFGDGARATGIQVDHTYAAAGTYTATVTVSDGKQRATSTATISVLPQPPPPVTNPPPSAVWVMGYYVGYHNAAQAPSAIDYSAVTHLVIGPALPKPGGSFETHFAAYGADGAAVARDTVARAHAAGVKVLLMVGGAGADMSAWRAVSDPTARRTFIANLQSLVDQFDLDGVDMDWEPLVVDGRSADEDDRNRFLALSQDVRAAMPDAVLLFPVVWNNANFDNLRNPYFGIVSQYYDRVNIMTYQMNWCGQGWETWHSSALFGETPSTPTSVDNSVTTLMESGVPPSKIGIGLGFWGQPYENGTWQNGAFVLHGPPYVTAPHQNSDATTIRVSDDSTSYSNIVRYYYEVSARRWDAVARVPYLTFATPRRVPVPSWANPPVTTTYVTYEDAESIAEKGAYVRARGLGGAIIWSISEGYLNWLTSGEKDPLMKAVKAAFLER